MRSKPSIIVFCLAAAVAAPALAQPPASRSAQQAEIPTLLSRLQHFFVASGRIRATLSSAISGPIESNNPLQGRQERLAPGMSPNGTPAVDYELKTRDAVVTVSATDNSISIRRAGNGYAAVTPVEFTQPAEGPLRLVVGEEELRREYQAQRLWELLIAEREACSEHLLPLLELLHPNWRLDRTAAEVEEILLRWARHRKLPNVDNWRELVEQLESDRFSVRQAAERQLRSAGHIALPYLESLEPDQLSPEQRYRLRRITSALAGLDDDRPERIASWLIADPSIWLALLDREDLDKRQLAAEHLSRLLGEPIEFNPAAQESVRAEQLESLRQKLWAKTG